MTSNDVDTTDQILDGRRIRGGASSSLFVDDKQYLNFAGCNYLAIADNGALRRAALQQLRAGSLFARFLPSAYGGLDEPFEDVERAASEFYGVESAVYFASGYFIGFAGLAGLDPLFDVVFLDEQAHWCLVDAARLCGKPVCRFAHDDVSALEDMLARAPKDRRPLIVTDGVFSTSGALAPLDKYAEIAAAHGGWLFVDESHAIGVLGEAGRGAVQHFGVEERSFVGTTLSKALCAQGAVFVGPREVVDRARMTSALRGSNPGSPISARVAEAALDLVRGKPELCRRVRDNAQFLRSELREVGIKTADAPTPIVSFGLKDFAATRALQEGLFARGIYVLHSNYIAAGPGGLIRMTVFADHAKQDLTRVARDIELLLSEHR